MMKIFPSDSLERQKLIIQDPGFTWSYSRIKKFEDCRYAWWLKYIEGCQPKELFFSQFGTFMHGILAKYYKGELEKRELPVYYLSNFATEVTSKAPNLKVFQSYFDSGKNYLLSAGNRPESNTAVVEREVEFDICGKKFIGFIDLLTTDEEGNISITDHKSRTLKPYSGRKNKTQYDKELDEYFKQLYLYAEAVRQNYGVTPKKLSFNCFRSGCVIDEDFNEEKMLQTITWANERINEISNNNDWRPDYEWFKCAYLCDLHDECEYYQMNKA